MHFGLICPDMTGHLNPMTTLGEALRQRGHRVSLIASPQAAGWAEARQLEFLAIGESEHRLGLVAADREKLGRLRGIAALRLTGAMLCNAAAIIQRDAPDVIRTSGVDALVWDQVSPGGESVAELLRLPHAMVCNALSIHSEPSVPPVVTSWPYRAGQLARWRNRAGMSLIQFAARGLTCELNRFRREHAIERAWHPLIQGGGLVQVAQQPAFFDFPRQRLPAHFHYTGPWHLPGRDVDVAFPWDRLDGRPLVYASLGTLQNRLGKLFAAIISACRGLDLQLVLSRGGSNIELDDGGAGGAIVVDYAPQLELIRRADIVITHAGLNTALETLACGVPMVAIPITNDQPGVARRLVELGTAVTMSPRQVTASRLRSALRMVQHEPSFRAAATDCCQRIEQSPTVADAAEIIESAIAMRPRSRRRQTSDGSRPV